MERDEAVAVAFLLKAFLLKLNSYFKGAIWPFHEARTLEVEVAVS